MDFRDVIIKRATVVELIEDALARVVAQDGVAYEPGVGCAYRASNGCRCIAGHMIPDDVYNLQLEGEAIVNVYENIRLPPIADLSLVWDAQRAHDKAVRRYIGHGNIERFRAELTDEVQELIGSVQCPVSSVQCPVSSVQSRLGPQPSHGPIHDHTTPNLNQG